MASPSDCYVPSPPPSLIFSPTTSGPSPPPTPTSSPFASPLPPTSGRSGVVSLRVSIPPFDAPDGKWVAHQQQQQPPRRSPEEIEAARRRREKAEAAVRALHALQREQDSDKTRPVYYQITPNNTPTDRASDDKAAPITRIDRTPGDRAATRREKAEAAVRALHALQAASDKQMASKPVSLVSTLYSSDEDGDDDEFAYVPDSEDEEDARERWTNPAAIAARKRQNRQGIAFYVRKCENHRHRVSRDTLRRCQENKGGCRLGAFRTKPTKPTKSTAPYPPRIADLVRNLRTSIVQDN